MRDFSNDHRALAINSATVKAWTLQQLVDGCRRHSITAIAPWRDLVQAVGIAQAGQIIRAAGLTVTSLCRAGLFPAADEPAGLPGRRACYKVEPHSRQTLFEIEQIGGVYPAKDGFADRIDGFISVERHLRSGAGC